MTITTATNPYFDSVAYAEAVSRSEQALADAQAALEEAEADNQSKRTELDELDLASTTPAKLNGARAALEISAARVSKTGAAVRAAERGVLNRESRIAEALAERFVQHLAPLTDVIATPGPITPPDFDALFAERRDLLHIQQQAPAVGNGSGALSTTPLCTMPGQDAGTPVLLRHYFIPDFHADITSDRVWQAADRARVGLHERNAGQIRVSDDGGRPVAVRTFELNIDLIFPQIPVVSVELETVDLHQLAESMTGQLVAGFNMYGDRKGYAGGTARIEQCSVSPNGERLVTVELTFGWVTTLTGATGIVERTVEGWEGTARGSLGRVVSSKLAQTGTGNQFGGRNEALAVVQYLAKMAG